MWGDLVSFFLSLPPFFLLSIPPSLPDSKQREQGWKDSPIYTDSDTDTALWSVLPNQLSPTQERTRTPGRGGAGFVSKPMTT